MKRTVRRKRLTAAQSYLSAPLWKLWSKLQAFPFTKSKLLFPVGLIESISLFHSWSIGWLLIHSSSDTLLAQSYYSPFFSICSATRKNFHKSFKSFLFPPYHFLIPIHKNRHKRSLTADCIWKLLLAFHFPSTFCSIFVPHFFNINFKYFKPQSMFQVPSITFTS